MIKFSFLVLTLFVLNACAHTYLYQRPYLVGKYATIIIETVKDSPGRKKYDIEFSLHNRHSDAIFLKLTEMECYKGKTRGRLKFLKYRRLEKPTKQDDWLKDVDVDEILALGLSQKSSWRLLCSIVFIILILLLETRKCNMKLRGLSNGYEYACHGVNTFCRPSAISKLS